jgi:hypothetical protein
MTKPRRFTAVAHMWCEIRLGISMIARRGILLSSINSPRRRSVRPRSLVDAIREGNP